MAVNTNISIAAAKAALNAVVDLLDAGTAANPTIKIFDGAQPDSPDDTTTASTLVTLDLGTAAVFGAATTGTGTLADTAIADAAGLTVTGTAGATGTAAWFRAYDKDGTAVIDGSVGTATADLILDNTSVAAAQQVKLKTWRVKLPKQ